MTALRFLRGICVCTTLVLTSFLFPASGLAREIELVDSPALSPDGTEIAFSYAGDIWTVPVEGGAARRLTIHPASESTPLYSPDGKQIAFVSDRTGSRQVFVETLDGSAPSQVTFHTEGYSLEDWSPDGKSLLAYGIRDHHWRRPQRLISLSLEKRRAEEIVFDAYAQDGRYSPDGKKILFCREGTRWYRKGYVGSQASQIWMYDLKSKKFTKLLDDPRGSRTPLWKPDGSGFYYVGATSGSFNLHEYDFESKESQQLTQFEDDSVLMPCISRDGKTIVFRHLFDLYAFHPTENKPPQKLEITTSGDDPIEESLRRNLTSANNVAFSPDGLEIIFAAGGDLWVMDTVLKEPVAITQTEVEEREPVMIEDGKAVLFLREEAGQVDLYRAAPADPKKYWWQNSDFDIQRLTNDPDTEHDIRKSPDGEHLAVVKGQGDLWLLKLDGTPVRKLVSGFDPPNYDFSPDGKWIVYSQEDNDFNDEVWIATTDGSREPFNVSRHPDDDVSPVWSPDGKIIAFTGQRNGEESDIYYVFLNPADDEESSRDKKLKEALEKLKKARPQAAKTQTTSAQKEAPLKAEKPDAEKTEKPAEEKKPEEKTDAEKKQPDLPKVVIDFDGLTERVRHVSIPDVGERGLFWMPDGKTLAFSANIKGENGTYTIEIKDRLAPKKLTSSTGSFIHYLKTKDKVAWLSSGKPGTLSTKGPTESYSFSARQELNVGERFRAAFDMAWRLMRDHWYDDRFANRNWSEIRRKYTDAAANAPDENALREVGELMLGELNGSHLGFYPSPSSPRAKPAWTETTPHLGLRFDPKFKGPGLKVRDVILDGPADESDSKIEAGEIVMTIDGTTVDPALDLTEILNGDLARDITLRVKNEKGEERDVTIRPISYSQARSLLYPQYEVETSQKVEELSDGKLGYIHIQGMNMSSFREFERQLYNVGYGKDGLIIDVRENGGGFTTDHMLTALTQPQHAITVPRGGGRGYPHDRKIYASWNKPIIVLCNQNSFSNAEIFSHAIKTLERGKVVGVTTAGGVISTGGAQVMDVGFLRQPFRGWFLMNGEDMELNGAQPDVELWPLPGELPRGKDRQLEKAIQLLKKDVAKFLKKQPPGLRKASERDVQPGLSGLKK